MDFKHAVDSCAPFPIEGFPIKGPLSCHWLLKHMLTHGGSPTSFHQRYMSETRLDYSAGGMSEHNTLCQAFEWFRSWDQIDVSKSAGCELLARKLQTIHEKWKHKLPSLNLSGAAGNEDDSMMLLGTHVNRAGVYPELSIWLGSELSKQALADKERRKAKEERALAAKDKRG